MGGSVFIGTRRNGKISAYDAHTSQIHSFVDTRVLAEDPQALEKLFKSAEPDLNEAGEVAPYSYGLVFVDFDTKHIWSRQDYTSVNRFSAMGMSLELRNNSRPGQSAPKNYFSDLQNLRHALENGYSVKAFAIGDQYEELDLLKMGLDTFDKIKAQLADRSSELYELSPDFIIEVPGWTYREFNDDADFLAIAEEMAEAGILSGTLAEGDSWDSHCADFDEDEETPLEKPSRVIASVLARREARAISDAAAAGKSAPRPNKI